MRRVEGHGGHRSLAPEESEGSPGRYRNRRRAPQPGLRALPGRFCPGRAREDQEKVVQQSADPAERSRP